MTSTRARLPFLLLAITLVVALPLGGCGSDDGGAASTGGADSSEPAQDVTEVPEDTTGLPDSDDVDNDGTTCDGLTLSVAMHNPDSPCTSCDSSEPFTLVATVRNPCDTPIVFEHYLGKDEDLGFLNGWSLTTSSSMVGSGSSCATDLQSTEIAGGSSIETKIAIGLLGDLKNGEFQSEGEFTMEAYFCTADDPGGVGVSTAFSATWPPD